MDNTAEQDGIEFIAPGRTGWFLVAAHALPEEWQHRAIPVFLVSLDAQDVEPFLPRGDLKELLDDEGVSVARLVSHGVSPRDIADQLHLSRRSVFRRLALLRQLTGSETNAELATKLAKLDI
jgi:DNA-binding NarL/FixJ family response regulator